MKEKAKKMVTIAEFEADVKRIEEIVVVVRGDKNKLVESYDFKRQAASTMSLTDFLEKRINPRVGSMEVSVYDGNFSENPHGRTSMDKLRKGYEK